MLLSTKEVRDILIEIEYKFPVDTWVIDNVHVWPLLRIQIYFALYFAGRVTETTQKKGRLAQLKRLIKSFYRFGKAYICDYKHNDSCNRTADCLFLTYTVHRTSLIGSWYDRYCNPYVDALSMLGLTSLVLEMSVKEEYRVPRHGLSKFIQPSLECIKIKSMLQKNVKALNEDLTGFDKLIEYFVKNKYEILIPDLDSLRSKVILLLHLKTYFKKIITNVKPSLVFIAEYYSLNGMALILASRECGVKTIDIQHGVQGEDHLSYGCWTKVPYDGYELLPSVFWCWSEYEAGVINKWNFNTHHTHQAFVGGNLWLELWKENNSDLVCYYDNMINRLKAKTSNLLHVLVTPGILSDLKDWIFTAIRESCVEVFWWIRVHPCRLEERKIVREMLDKYELRNVDLDNATDLPLQALLRHVHLNVTSFSTTVYDAECYGIPSVLTDDSGATLFPQQIASGMATIATNSNELLKAINEQVAKKRKKVEFSRIDNRETMKKFLQIHGELQAGISF